MVTFSAATNVAKMMLLTALAWAPAYAVSEQPRQIPVKFRWLTADVSWDTAARKGLTRAQMEIEVPEEGYPMVGLAKAPTMVNWDGSSVHPSAFLEVQGKPGLRYLKVKAAAGSVHRLEVEYEAAMEKVEAVPVSTETTPTPFVLRFDDPQLTEHELQTNGLALPAGEGKWAVRFQESSSGVYLALPDPAESDRKGGFKKLVRWFIRIPFSIFGGGGEGPPPLVTYHRK